MPRVRALTCIVAAVLVAGLAACAPQGPKPKSDFFGNLNAAGYPEYHGDFPDGMVMWDAASQTYYGYSTPTGGRNLPIISSTDLVHWNTHPVYHPAGQPFSDPWFNDGMTKWAQWAWEMPSWTGVGSRKKIWAPHVAKFGNTYVDFYAVAISDTDGDPGTYGDEKFCITYATSTSPMGPFHDDTTGPLVCGDKAPPPYNHEPSNNPNGSIDPSVTFDQAGNAYLLWKNSGAPMPGSNTRLMSRKLAATATTWTPGFAPGSSPRELLATINNSWMGSPGGIEQPQMIEYAGQWWLFYSGANTEDWTYAIGYGVCDGPLGPCRHWTVEHPLLSSFNSPYWGPGAGTPFLDAHGNLKLSFHYWANNNPGYEWRADGLYGMRPMRIADLTLTPWGFQVHL